MEDPLLAIGYFRKPGQAMVGQPQWLRTISSRPSGPCLGVSEIVLLCTIWFGLRAFWK